MTGPEHYLESERLAELAEQRAHSAPGQVAQGQALSQALVFATLSGAHAQLAAAAAVALQSPGGEDAGMRVADLEEWEAAASAAPDNT